MKKYFVETGCLDEKMIITIFPTKTAWFPNPSFMPIFCVKVQAL